MGIAPGYVMDDMPVYEAELLLSNAWMVDQAAAERMRMICWMTAQVNSKKQLKPEDLFKFSWEMETKEPPRFLSKQEVEAMRAKAIKIRKEINHGKK